MARTCLGFLLGGSTAGKKCDDNHRKKNFFINNSVEVLIPHEVHRGLLKLHLHLGGIPENYRNTLPLHTVDKN